MTGPSVRIAAVDLNGQFRGKRLAPGSEGKAVRLPLSALNVDIFGADIDGSPLVFETGDQDGVLRATGRGPLPLPWLERDTVLQPCSLYLDDGSPFEGDPRHALASVLDKFEKDGLTVIAACELEFFLVEQDGNLAAPRNPRTGKRLAQTDILSLRELDGFEAFFNDVEAAATKMGIDPLVITSEAGVGQFEITMTHGPAMKIADDVILLKELIKGTANAHGMSATFLAKPFANESGSGMHTHFSVLNQSGENIFCDDNKLKSAIAGCLNLFRSSTLFFAPHQGSYQRFVDNAHAPTTASWGFENRTVSLRVPGGPKSATRIEHRAAGGDINPYLMFSAIFGAALIGLQDNLSAPKPVEGNAYEITSDIAGLHTNWSEAIGALSDPVLHRIFAPKLLEYLAATKQQELKLLSQMSDHDIKLACLEAV